jgi:2-phospho-L-lactate guanylyltransferase
MPRTTWAIVPVKRLSQAKRRLVPVLPAEARRRLVLAMLADVLGAVAHVEGIDKVLVVTPDAVVAEVAREAGAFVLAEPRAAGLNAAVTAGLDYASAQGASAAVVLPGDVPLATAAEIRRIVKRDADGAPARVVLVPSHDGEGTNALFMSPPGLLRPSFGPGSFLKHLGQAVARKADVEILQPPGLAADVDTPHDLDRLMAAKRGAAAYAFLGSYLRKPESPLQHSTGRTEP